MLFVILIIILVLSFILALGSMKDFTVPKEVRQLFKINKVSGTIMFFKEKIKHYSSSSSSSSGL